MRENCMQRNGQLLFLQFVCEAIASCLCIDHLHVFLTQVVLQYFDFRVQRPDLVGEGRCHDRRSRAGRRNNRRGLFEECDSLLEFIQPL